ncbi:MAG: IPT/TIG domain-containing protein [Legionellales bacterium]|nr:IPT/TIG domain-containing protein [Legionellales bacterium]
MAKAGAPLWTFTPLTATAIAVPANGTATVQYRVTNQSSKTHRLAMQAIPGIHPITTGLGICGNPFILTGKASCILSLQVEGNELTQSITDGPIVCEQGSALQCYRPSAANRLDITQAPPISSATISVSRSPVTLVANGGVGSLTINNTSSTVTATNIMSDFTGTALEDNVTETGNTCANLPPLASCLLIYTPGSVVVPLTQFPIHGSNTNTINGEIRIDSGSTLISVTPASGSAAGGQGVVLAGTGLTGSTAVTFDGIAATSVHVVNSTTVTAVTPAHVSGAVDVVISTPNGNITLPNGYSYLLTQVGQAVYGGVIACLNGGLNNLIAATADNSTSIAWGGAGTLTNASSNADGAANTVAIESALGANGGVAYAAKLCSDYEVDSQGNTPCQAGNTCYSDWFLPAGNGANQLDCLYQNRIAIGGFNPSAYWSSTEASVMSTLNAFYEDFSNGHQNSAAKGLLLRVRCVRAFTP